jgi:hypothetical protein
MHDIVVVVVVGFTADWRPILYHDGCTCVTALGRARNVLPLTETESLAHGAESRERDSEPPVK